MEYLNRLAVRKGLVAFPLGLIFTVRENYWRKWESIFEGHKSILLKNRISKFTENELKEALNKYCHAYEYRIATFNKIVGEARDILSLPFNLQIFSEANEYHGLVSIENVLTSHVLHLFFKKKGENILRQRIPGFDQESLIKICAKIAIFILKKGINKFIKADILKIIKIDFCALNGQANQVIIAIISEQIIVEEDGYYRLRHTQFLEYLVAYYIVLRIEYEGTTSEFDAIISVVVDSVIVSVFSVHEYIRHICESDFPHLMELIESYYANSKNHMQYLTTELRAKIAGGFTTTEQYIKLMLKNTDTSNANLTRSSFFILAAKSSKQPSEKLLQAFKIAWKSNSDSSERWKLLVKMAAHNLLVTETVFFAVVDAGSWKEWQVYLGCIIESSTHQQDFVDFWVQVDNPDIFNSLHKKIGEEWKQVTHLLDIILNKKVYIPGSIL